MQKEKLLKYTGKIDQLLKKRLIFASNTDDYQLKKMNMYIIGFTLLISWCIPKQHKVADSVFFADQISNQLWWSFADFTRRYLTIKKPL